MRYYEHKPQGSLGLQVALVAAPHLPHTRCSHPAQEQLNPESTSRAEALNPLKLKKAETWQDLGGHADGDRGNTCTKEPMLCVHQQPDPQPSSTTGHHTLVGISLAS